MWQKVACLVIALMVGVVGAQEDGRTPDEHCAVAIPIVPETRSFEKAEDVLLPNTDYRAIFCTAAGAIYVDLFEEITPVTVNNFVFLVERGYFNDTTFHRVLQDFMAQGGDPTATGRGGPGYQFRDEFRMFLTFENAGQLAMANANNPERGILGTNGSQFFITLAPTTWLNYRHTIFGEVLEGMDSVEGLKICDPAQCESGDALMNVLIIDEPVSVAITQPTQEVPAPAALAARIENFFVEASFPDLGYRVAHTTTEDLLGRASDEKDQALENFLSAYGLEYRIEAELDTCSEDYGKLRGMSFALEAYPDARAAAAAFADDYWRQLEAANLAELDQEQDWEGVVYGAAVTVCESERGRRVLMRYRYGRNLLQVGVLIALPEVEPDQSLNWLQNAQYLYEPLLSDVLRQGLRKN